METTQLPSLGSLSGTLTGEQVLSQMQALQDAQRQELEKRAQEAVAAQQQAAQQYQQAAAQPAPTVSPEAAFVPTLVGNLASVISQNPTYRQGAQEGIQSQKATLLKQRAENLQALRDVYQQKAEEAQKAGDLDVTEKYRTKLEGLSKTFELVNANADRQNRLDIAKIQASKPAAGSASQMSPEEIESIADAIATGRQPPVFTGLYRNGGPVRAALARKGVNITKMQADWGALTRHYASLNGTIQVRLRQAAANASGSVQVVREINDNLESLNLPRTRVEAFNRAGLAAIRNGVFGQEAAQWATQLSGQISALQSELANVYQGGGVPTDEARKMAQRIINDRMSPSNMVAALDLADRDINIRLGAIDQTGAISPSNPQTPPGQAQGSFNIGSNPMEIAGGQVQATGKTAKMTDTKGKTRYIDEAEVEEAIAKGGWKRAR